jgi:hypothetical protein
MQFTIQPGQFLSHVLAAVMLALPLAGLASALDRAEQEMLEKLSHQDRNESVRGPPPTAYRGPASVSPGASPPSSRRPRAGRVKTAARAGQRC